MVLHGATRRSAADDGGCVSFWKRQEPPATQSENVDDELVDAVAERMEEFAGALLTVSDQSTSPYLNSGWFVESSPDATSPLGQQVIDYLRAELSMEPEWTVQEWHEHDVGDGSTLTWFGSVWPLVVMTQPARATPHGSCVHVRLMVPTFQFEDPAVGQHYATVLNGQVATSFTWAFSTLPNALTAEASLLVAATDDVVPGITVNVARLRLVALETYSLALHGANQLFQLLRDDGTVDFTLATTMPPTGTVREQGAPLALNVGGHIGQYAERHGNQWPDRPARQVLQDYLHTLPEPLCDAFCTTLRLDEEFGPRAGGAPSPTYAVRVPFPEQDQLAYIFVAADSHPTVGEGLMLRLETPYRIDGASVPHVLERLHRHEVSALSGTPLLGFWFTWPPDSGKFVAGPGEHTLSFGTFLPSIRAGHVDPADAVGHLFRRARLLRELFGPAQPPPSPPLRVDPGAN